MGCFGEFLVSHLDAGQKGQEVFVGDEVGVIHVGKNLSSNRQISRHVYWLIASSDF